MSPVVGWVTAFLDFPGSSYDAGVGFWRAVTASGLAPSRGEYDEFATLLPPDGDAYLRVQRLGEGPRRIHLDLHVPDVRAAADRATALGARIAHEPPEGYVVLASPGGLTFCLVGHPFGVRPAPVTWGGHASLVDQVTLDIPPEDWEAETGFWSELTGWELTPSPTRREFAALVRPPEQPLRLLLQRLDAGTGPVTAHLDLASTDRAAEVARHLALGAVHVWDGPHWTVLRDPSGASYCVTDRVPDTGLLPVVPLRP